MFRPLFLFAACITTSREHWMRRVSRSLVISFSCLCGSFFSTQRRGIFSASWITYNSLTGSYVSSVIFPIWFPIQYDTPLFRCSRRLRLRPVNLSTVFYTHIQTFLENRLWTLNYQMTRGTWLRRQISWFQSVYWFLLASNLPLRHSTNWWNAPTFASHSIRNSRTRGIVLRIDTRKREMTCIIWSLFFIIRLR